MKNQNIQNSLTTQAERQARKPQAIATQTNKRTSSGPPVRSSDLLGDSVWNQYPFLKPVNDKLMFKFHGAKSITANRYCVQFLVNHLNQWLSSGKICPLPPTLEFPPGSSFLGLVVADK